MGSALGSQGAGICDRGALGTYCSNRNGAVSARNRTGWSGWLGPEVCLGHDRPVNNCPGAF